MKNSFRLQVLNAGPHYYCDEHSEEGVHISGPMNVRRDLVVVVELQRAVSTAVLAPLLSESLGRCGVTRVRLFDEKIPVTPEQVRKVLRKQSELGQ